MATWSRTADADETECAAVTILSVAFGGGSVGAALYDVATMSVAVMSDTPDQPPNFPLVQALLGQTQPDQVVSSCRQDERLLHQLKQMFTADQTIDSTQSPLHLTPAGDFRADNCRHRVMAIKLSTDTSRDDTEHQSYIHSQIDFSQTSMIRALGGLLKFLDRTPQQTGLGHQHVMRIDVLTLEDVMFVSRGSFLSLQVFSNVSHPSSYKAETIREGLSVFGILNKCASKLGVVQLKRMLLQPLKNRRRIEERLDAVEFFTLHENQEVVASLQTNLCQLRSLRPLLSRMFNWHALASDWNRLNLSMMAAVSVLQICKELSPGIEVFRRATDIDGNVVYDLLQTLQNTVNFSETRELSRFSVQLGLDPQLDRWKQMYGDMSIMLEENLRKCQPELPEQVDTSSMTFFPLIGFVVLVESWNCELTLDQKTNLPGLQFQFSDEDRFFYKTEHCRRLDDEIGDMSLAISDAESSIQQRLIQMTISATDQIHSVLTFCGEIDALLSLARSAIEFNYIRPQFVDDNYIQLLDSRHPLLEISCQMVVPNDFKSGLESNSDRMKIITGANGGGKSVYLKQVALCVLLAQVGSFVPASSARLGVQDALLTVMPARQCATGQQSCFLQELCQLSGVLQVPVAARSLLLLDELGGGTLEEDGTALLAAALGQLLARRQQCPHTLVSTHAHRLLQLLPPSQLLTPLSPQVLLEPQTGQLTFLYQMTGGSCAPPATSHAIAAARLVDLPEQLLERAQQVCEALTSGALPAEDEDLKERMSLQLDQCCSLVEAFLGCDLDTESVPRLLDTLRHAVQQPASTPVGSVH